MAEMHVMAKILSNPGCLASGFSADFSAPEDAIEAVSVTFSPAVLGVAVTFFVTLAIGVAADSVFPTCRLFSRFVVMSWG